MTISLGIASVLLFFGADQPALSTKVVDPKPVAQHGRNHRNVVLIVADDLNMHLGCYGNPVHTPNLDRLAARGVRFDRAYCQYPLCNPSRTSFLSGKRPASTGVLDNTTRPHDHSAGEVPYLPEHFRTHGYQTARFGKIAHNSFEDAISWDVSYSPPVFSNATRKRFDELWKAGEERSSKLDVTFAIIAKHQEFLTHQTGAAPIPRERGVAPNWSLRQMLWYAATVHHQQLTDDGADEPDALATSRAVEFVEGPHERPFLLSLGFYRPHLPWVAPASYFDLHPTSKIALPFMPPEDGVNVPFVAKTPLGLLFSNPSDDDSARRAIQAYHATISFMDALVGRLLNSLERRGILESTAIVFVSDHGYHLGEHRGLWHKLSLFEESVQVPLIVSAPGFASGQSASGLVELVDLYPTMTELAGIPSPGKLDGRSFVPLLSQPHRPGKEAAYSELIRQGMGDVRGRSVRTERFRYTDWGAHGEELYDHPSDPGEHRNLAPLPAYASIRATLRELAARNWPDMSGAPSRSVIGHAAIGH